MADPAVPERTVHRMFERQAARFPEAIAVAAARGSLTYGDLNLLADRIAAALRRRGVGPGQIVMVGVERSVETVSSFLGVLKTGAAYCPLDLQDPPARHALMFEDARPRAILTTRNSMALLGGYTGLCLCVDELEDRDAAEPIAASADVDTDSPAAVMYTSGSTGRPKGALVPHRGILRLFFGSEYVPFGPQLRTLFHSPPHFDTSTFEIWAPLLHGGTCGVFPGDRIPSLRALGEAIQQFAVNCLFLGPAFFNVIIDEDPQILTGLSDVLVGGEAMSARHMRSAMALFPSTRFLNVYGPTETTTFATAYAIPADFPADAKSVPIGKPIGGTECYLLDEHRSPVTNGAIAELYIGGQGVALGYANRPELTAERFVTDPFNMNRSARMYRTGDLCRRLADGNLDFVGRLDSQLKIRGHRVEPGEIETQLLAHPAVSQAVVITAEHAGQIILIAYFTLRANAVCTAEQIDQHLRERLPPYLVPRLVIALGQMPVTPSGTIDRAALPPARLTAHASSSAPTTPREQQLLSMWQAVLEESAVGIDDDFFEMGGNSLDAMRLCLMVEKTTGVFVPISMLLAAATVRRFAEALAESAQPFESSYAIPFCVTGNRAPIYFIGGDVGHPLELRALATMLSADRPIYGLQLPGLDGVSTPLDSVQAAALHLLPIVRKLSGSKPIHLLGYCYGGPIAYELACLLRESSASGGRLVLIDTWTAASYVPKPFHRRAMTRFRYHSKRGPVRVVRDLYSRMLGRPSTMLPQPQGHLDELILKMQTANLAAFYQYVPGRYPGDIISIRASEDDGIDLRMSPGSGGWEAVAGGSVHTHTSPGDHSSMIRPPNVTALARLIEQQLDGAE